MAFDTYIKFTPDVPGEATQEFHKGETEIYSFSLGASNPTTVGTGTSGLAAGKASVSSFNLMKKTDKTSPILFQSCCTGKHYDSAIVSLSKATGDGGQQQFLKYTFTDVMIESVQWSGSSGGDDTPTESLSFAFAKIEVEYQQQDAKGAVSKPVLGGWNIQTASAK